MYNKFKKFKNLQKFFPNPFQNRETLFNFN